jgi:RNA polymerase sigma factor (sigma-70 family)
LLDDCAVAVATDGTTNVAPPELGSGGSTAARREPGVNDQELAVLVPAVRGVVRYVLGGSANDVDVDDCAGEVFKRAIEHRSRLEPGTSLRLWVLGIARNVGLDARRARRRALARSGPQSPAASSDAGAASDDEPSALDRIADGTPGPDQRLELAQRADRLQAALRALPEDQRRAVLLYAEGYGYREIGERLSAPLGTICTWISRARQGLSRTLKEDRR